MHPWKPASPADQAHFPPPEVFAAGLKQHHLANTAYPIGHTVTMRPYRVAHSQIECFTAQAWQAIDRLGLYVHVPFCEQRCGYCEYCVVAPDEFRASEDGYFDLLLGEFELYRRAIQTETKTLIGFDIGGGTPSAAKTAHIARVLAAAQQSFQLPNDVVISIETTPRIAAGQPEKINAYYQMGIRRISMGVQMVNPRLLAMLGRPHTSLDYDRAAAEAIRAAGFEKFNIDIMYGFAGQTVKGVEATLKHVISLAPEYVTLYRMRYKGTRMAGQAEHVSREAAYAQYQFAHAFLHAAGYLATPGKNTFSRIPDDPGTSDYLTQRVVQGTPYLGFGLGAQSLSEVTLAYNAGAAEKRLDRYRRMVQAGKLPLQDLYHLSRETAMGKMVSVAFYFGEINLPAFRQKFGQTLEAAFPDEVAFVLAEGLMNYSSNAEALRLTEKGVENYNGVIALFYAPAVQAHLLQLAKDLAVDGRPARQRSMAKPTALGA
ncbi:MAG: coproporphyrinogen-III oxidase family protein [Chloroflexota bacterium]